MIAQSDANQNLVETIARAMTRSRGIDPDVQRPATGRDGAPIISSWELDREWATRFYAGYEVMADVQREEAIADANMNEINFISTDADVDAAVAEAVAAQRDMKMVELTEAAQEVLDLLHALDKIGDGIGGADGFAVSAVATAARSVADNLLCSLKVMARAA